MSRNPVLVETCSGADLAAALRSHVAERERLFEALKGQFEQDERIRAGWLWGSFMRSEQDALSDLDVWLAVPDECADQMAAPLAAMCKAAGTVVFAAQNKHNSPKNGGYLGALVAGTHGLHHLDIYWQAMSAVEYPDAEMFLDRRKEGPLTSGGYADSDCQSTSPLPSEGEVGEYRGTRANRERGSLAELAKSPHQTTLEDPDPNENRIAFIWLMLSVAAKYLARDPSSDMSLISYPQKSFEEVATEMGRTDLIATTRWTAGDDPADKVQMLQEIARNTSLLEDALRTTGLPLSPLANPCLTRYFDLVNEFLAHEGA